MKRIQRMMGVLVLAGLLASGVATAAPRATAAGGVTLDAAPSRAQLCAQLADYIQRLKALPPSPLRDVLVRIALSLQARYCA